MNNTALWYLSIGYANMFLLRRKLTGFTRVTYVVLWLPLEALYWLRKTLIE